MYTIYMILLTSKVNRGSGMAYQTYPVELLYSAGSFPGAVANSGIMFNFWCSCFPSLMQFGAPAPEIPPCTSSVAEH